MPKKVEILVKDISVPAGEILISGLICMPNSAGPFPAVVIFHGSDGFKANHREIAKKLARENFTALAISWFGGNPSRPHWDMVRPNDILESILYLDKEPAVDSNRIGLIGFSRGAGLALIMGSLLPKTKAIVNYFGLTSWEGGMEEFRYLPLNKEDHLDFLKRVPCPILSFHGLRDTVVPVENTYHLDSSCRKYGIDHTYFVYPNVDHSFIWPGDKYDREAHAGSWNKAVRFLKANLYPR